MYATLPNLALRTTPCKAVHFLVQEELRASLQRWLRRAVQAVVQSSAYVRELVLDGSHVLPDEVLLALAQAAVAENAAVDAEKARGDETSSPTIIASVVTTDFIESLEVHLVNVCVLLAQALASPSDADRAVAAILLWDFAMLWDPSFADDFTIQSIMWRVHADHEDYLLFVQFLFEMIAPSLSIMITALVSALECYYKVDNYGMLETRPASKSVAVIMLTQLVMSCNVNSVQRVQSQLDKLKKLKSSTTFTSDESTPHSSITASLTVDDKLSIIWNLFFAMTSYSEERQGVDQDAYNPQRLIMIKALGELAPLFCAEDHNLTLRVVEGLLKVQRKTGKEKEAIKWTLRRIYERLSKREDIYKVFLSLINPNSEHAYDLLSWAIEIFAHTSRPASAATTKPLSITSSSSLLQYIDSLSNHFRAATPLVRHGAAISLYSSLRMHAKLLDENNQLYNFVIAGVLDPDYLISSVYLSILSSMSFSSNNGVKQLIQKYRLCVTTQSNYDDLTRCMTTPREIVSTQSSTPREIASAYRETSSAQSSKNSNKQSIEVTKKQSQKSPTALSSEIANVRIEDLNVDFILNIASKRCSAPVIQLLQKIATTLDHLPYPLKLKQIAVIKYWSTNCTQYDHVTVLCLLKLLDLPTITLQDVSNDRPKSAFRTPSNRTNNFSGGRTKSGHLSSTEEAIQIAALDALSAISPTFKKATVAESSLIWSHIKELLSSKNPSERLVLSLLQLLSTFPLLKLGALVATEVLFSLFHMIFSRSTTIRKQVYTIIGEKMPLWGEGSIGLGNAAFTVLLMALGDANLDCMDVLINQLQAIGSKYKVLTPLLQSVQMAGRDRNPFDDLANVIVRDREDFDAVIRFASQETVTDTFWTFYLSNVPDNMQIRPDEYDYTSTFVQQPYWVSLLLSKLSLRPPPCPTTEKRGVLPNVAALKRRFYLGYALMLLPSAVISDSLIRQQACMCFVRCCFRQVILNTSTLRSLLEYIQNLFLMQKAWTYQTSAYDIIKMVIKLKLPGVSQSLFARYINVAQETVQNYPLATVRMAALELLETCVFSFPVGISTKLGEIRDCIRPFIADKDPALYTLAMRIWPLIFRTVSETNAPAFLEYLKDEINTIKRGKTQVQADLLLKHLTKDELTRVAASDIMAMGAFRSSALAPAIVRDLLVLVRNPNRYIREAAVSAVLCQLRLLTDVHRNAIMWVLLPLFCDPCENVRRCYMEKTSGVPDQLEVASKVFSPHPDDTFVLESFELEQVMVESSMFSVALRNLNDCLPVNTVEMPDNTNNFMAEISCYRPTLIAKELLLKFKDIASQSIGVVPEHFITEVLYYLQSYDSVQLLMPVSYLVISEFVCLHDKLTTEVVDLFIAGVDIDFSLDKRCLFEASLLGLRNISEFSSTTFTDILQKLMSSDVITDGCIVALSYLADLIKDICPNKMIILLDKYIPLVMSNKQTILRRIWAANLCSDMALASDKEQINRVAEALQQLLEVAPEDSRPQILNLMAKIFAQLEPEHPLFIALANWAKQNLFNSSSSYRVRCLRMFQVVARHMPPSEHLHFTILFLADPTTELRRKAIVVLMANNFIPEVLSGLDMLRKSEAERKLSMKAIVEFVNRPVVAELGLRQDKILGFELDYTVPLKDKDAYNLDFYTSDKRIKYSNFYGLPKSAFTQHTKPVFKGVLAKIEEVFVEKGVTLTPQEQLHCKELESVDTLIILRETIRRYPEETSQIVETILSDIERWISTETTMGMREVEKSADLDRLLHLYDLLGNLLLAGDDAIMEVGKCIGRLKVLISKCAESVHTIREDIFNNLEKSLFFFNEYMDVPITSEEQYEAWEKMKEELQEATLDVMRTGQADKLSRFEERRNMMNRAIEEKTESLRKLTIVQLQSTAVLALVCAASISLTEAEVIAYADFFKKHLSDEHRTIRAIIVEAVSALCKVQAAPNSNVAEYINKTVASMMTVVRDQGPLLFRRKVDYIRLITLLVSFHLRQDIETELLKMLISLWRDPDDMVKATAIEMIKELGKAGSTVVLASFQDDTGLVRTNVDGVTIADGKIRLLKEISALISNPEYQEKDQLNDLLSWYFNRKIDVAPFNFADSNLKKTDSTVKMNRSGASIFGLNQ